MCIMNSKALIPVLTLTAMVAAPIAMAADTTGRLGAGLSKTLGSAEADDKVALTSRYWLTEQTGVQGSLCYRSDEADGGYEAATYELALKGVFAPIVRENGKFLLSLEAGYAHVDVEYDSKYGKQDRSSDGWFVYPAIGVEFMLSGLPELGLNVEVGYRHAHHDHNIDYGNGSLSYGDSDTESQGVIGSVGTIYYF